MLKFDLSKLEVLINKFKDDSKIKNIVESEFLNYLSRISEKMIGQKNHRFKNREGLLEKSVDYYLDGDLGYIVSDGIEYNSYIYYGSEKHDTTWGGDPWIENVYIREKNAEQKRYKTDLTRELNVYLT